MVGGVGGLRVDDMVGKWFWILGGGGGDLWVSFKGCGILGFEGGRGVVIFGDCVVFVLLML